MRVFRFKFFTSPVKKTGKGMQASRQAGWYAGNQAKKYTRLNKRTHFIGVDRVNVSTTIKITYILFETRKPIEMKARELKYRIVLCIFFLLRLFRSMFYMNGILNQRVLNVVTGVVLFFGLL